MVTRRNMLIRGAALAGGAALTLRHAGQAQATTPPLDARGWQPHYSGAPAPRQAAPPGREGKDYQPVITPNGATLPWRLVDGVKVYHLIAEPVRHEFSPGLEANCWGYNGRVHGPTIEAVEGDRVRVYVTNKLIAPTTVHWHGVFLPSGMDGVGGLNQRAIMPGETFKYEWTFRQHGTFMYHSHHDEMTQMALGMMGLIIVHPRKPREGYAVDRDFAMMLSQWKLDPGAERPDPNEMNDFNLLTLNGRCFPGTAPLVARKGDRIRIRIGNLGPMDHHPIHLHGFHFRVVATDGGDIPREGQWPQTTVLVPVGATRTIEFIADEPGDWAMHCHMTHHAMNQMGHGIPNVVGADLAGIDAQIRPLLPGYMSMGHDGMGEMGKHVEEGHMPVPPNSIPMVGAFGPHDYITMGGMFTILKVREGIKSYDDPGWYVAPPGMMADLASEEELRRDLGV